MHTENLYLRGGQHVPDRIPVITANPHCLCPDLYYRFSRSHPFQSVRDGPVHVCQCFPSPLTRHDCISHDLLGSYRDSYTGFCPKRGGNTIPVCRNRCDRDAVWLDNICVLSLSPDEGCPFLICWYWHYCGTFLLRRPRCVCNVRFRGGMQCFYSGRQDRPGVCKYYYPVCLGECRSRSLYVDRYPLVSFTEFYDYQDTSPMILHRFSTSSRSGARNSASRGTIVSPIYS
jgi:hypothetical protein